MLQPRPRYPLTVDRDGLYPLVYRAVTYHPYHDPGYLYELPPGPAGIPLGCRPTLPDDAIWAFEFDYLLEAAAILRIILHDLPCTWEYGDECTWGSGGVLSDVKHWLKALRSEGLHTFMKSYWPMTNYDRRMFKQLDVPRTKETTGRLLFDPS